MIATWIDSPSSTTLPSQPALGRSPEQTFRALAIWIRPPMPSTLASIVSRSTFNATTFACSSERAPRSMYRIEPTAKVAPSTPWTEA
jgi:hypothetical protein